MTTPAATLDAVRRYCDEVLRSSSDLKTGAYCDAQGLPPVLRKLLEDVHREVKDPFHRCGSPLPPALEGRRVLAWVAAAVATCTCYRDWWARADV